MMSKTVRAKFAAASALTVVLGAIALFTTAGGSPALSDQLFAQRIAGAYLVDTGTGSKLLVNLEAGGTSLREFSLDYLGLSGLPNLPFFVHSGGHGNWVRTGPRTLHAVELSMLFNEDGSLKWIERNEIDLEFDDNFQSATGSFAAEMFLPDQNPLSGESGMPFSAGDGLIARRIQ